MKKTPTKKTTHAPDPKQPMCPEDRARNWRYGMVAAAVFVIAGLIIAYNPPALLGGGAKGPQGPAPGSQGPVAGPPPGPVAGTTPALAQVACPVQFVQYEDGQAKVVYGITKFAPTKQGDPPCMQLTQVQVAGKCPGHEAGVVPSNDPRWMYIVQCPTWVRPQPQA